VQQINSDINHIAAIMKALNELDEGERVKINLTFYILTLKSNIFLFLIYQAFSGWG